MAKLVPVDYDPFAEQSKGPRLVPVDGDPFAKAPQAPQRGIGEEVVRQLGLTGRYALEGLGQAVGVFSDPIALAVPGANMRMGELASYGADKLGLPQPEGGFERVVGGATRAGVSALPTMGAGGIAAQAPGLTGRVGKVIADTPFMQTLAAMSGGGSAETAKEMGAGPGGQLVAGLVGALAPSSAAATARGLFRGGDVGRQNMLANIETYQRAGAGTPTAAQAAGNYRSRLVESLLGKAPGSSGVIANAGEAQQAGIGVRVRSLADQLSTKASPEQAGRGIERGILGPGGFMSEFRKKASQLYGEVDNFIPPNTPMPVASTKRTLDSLTAPTPGAEQTSRALASGKVADLRDALDSDLQASLAAAGRGELPYSAVKALRSRLGDLIADSTFATDVPTKQLKQVYGSLSDDLAAAAKATNDPAAIRAVTRANTFYKSGMTRVDELERVIERNGGPEKVFQAATSGSREGATTLRAVMQSLPVDGQKQLTAAVVRRLGRANPSAQDDLGEVFSSETFLKNWNNLSPEAKSSLFGRFGPGYAADMEAVAKASAGIRAGNDVLKNAPGTAAAGAQFGTAAAFVMSVMQGSPGVAAGIGAGVGSTYTMAKALTSPTVVKWLAQQTKVPVAALPVQLARLKAEALAEGDVEALQFARELERSAGE